MKILGKNYIISNKVKSKTAIISYCLFLSIIFLLICTKSSPLYPLNDWVDSNSFFTMGKGMINGKVLYSDLFEQKGPLLYFLHAIAYLISNKTFFGVFVLEVISFAIFLGYCHKIIRIFIEKKYSFIGLPFISIIVLNLSSFTHGDSAEEFCLPLLTISLYYLIKYIKSGYEFKNYKEFLINGVIAGCVLWIKYSLLGFWFAWMLMLFISMVKRKEYVKSIISSLIFLSGMLVATIPWVVYFGVNDSIYTFIDSYIIVNVKYYSETMSILNRVKFVLQNIYHNIQENLSFGFLCGTTIMFIISKRYIKDFYGKITLITCIGLAALGVFGGGKAFIYYFLILSPFIVMGVIVLLDLLANEYNDVISDKVAAIICVVILIILVPINIKYNHNSYMLKINKEDLVQYKFASIINETKNATLLNYGSLDCGFYTATGITPNVKYFHQPNFDYTKYPYVEDGQKRYIKDKEVDYIIIRIFEAQDLKEIKIPYLYENYKFLAQENQRFEGFYFKYFLFKKK